MKHHFMFWVLIALGFAMIVQLLGPYIIGSLMAYGLHRFQRTRNTAEERR